MSGPVWRLLTNQPSHCSECGRAIETYRAVGRVVNDQLQVDERYCDDCYRVLGRFVDEAGVVRQQNGR